MFLSSKWNPALLQFLHYFKAHTLSFTAWFQYRPQHFAHTAEAQKPHTKHFFCKKLRGISTFNFCNLNKLMINFACLFLVHMNRKYSSIHPSSYKKLLSISTTDFSKCLKNLERIHYVWYHHSWQATGEAGNVPTAGQHGVCQPIYWIQDVITKIGTNICLYE
jgi:hypothetical protein